MPFGLVSVTLNNDGLDTPTIVGANVLVTVGAVIDATVRVAVPPDALLPCDPLTIPVVLTYEPALALVTLTVRVQLPPAGIVPPVSDIELPPAADGGEGSQ